MTCAGYDPRRIVCVQFISAAVRVVRVIRNSVTAPFVHFQPKRGGSEPSDFVPNFS